jgi:HPt (histidine-containing phosphotransfer) domain-containing protein
LGRQEDTCRHREPYLSPYFTKPLVTGIEKAMSSYLDQEGRCSEAKELCWNRSAALESVSGDESLLDEVVAIFLVESPKLVSQMEQALLHREPRRLEMAAHCLGVPEAYEAAQKLEDAGRTGNMEGAADLLDGLRTRLAGLWAAVGGNPGV